ncbi:MAG: hypothetical protein RLY43_797 [Bacteroidota bacterium]|jgi:hypothetical protein
MKKKLILLLLVSPLIQAQKMTIDYLEGQWTSNGESSEIIFKKNGKKDLEIIEYYDSGKTLTILGYQIAKNKLYIEAVINDWKSISMFTIIDEDTMVADIVSDAPGYIVYKRVVN